MVGVDHSKLIEFITRALIKPITVLIKMSAVNLHWHGISVSPSVPGSCLLLKDGVFIWPLFLIVTCFIKINSTALR